MRSHHWIMMFVILLIGYGLGVTYPGFGNSAASKVGSIVS